MRAAQFASHGGPEVLWLVEVTVVNARAGGSWVRVQPSAARHPGHPGPAHTTNPTRYPH